MHGWGRGGEGGRKEGYKAYACRVTLPKPQILASQQVDEKGREKQEKEEERFKSRINL